MSSAARITREPTPAGQLPPVVTELAVRRFTLHEYHRMLAAGILKNREPYELLEGVIAAKMPQNSPHAGTAGKLEKRLWRMIPDDWLLRTQKPISIPGSESEPEPDVAVCLGPDTRYDNGHPGPGDVALVAEVSDTSVPTDKGRKLRIYAGAKIAVYWIVNLVDRRVEVYTQPRGGKNPGYRTRADYGPGDAVPVVVGGTELGIILVKELLP